ncbi:MAG: hypothetical protein U0236_17995 [Nitrospira sp.]
MAIYWVNLIGFAMLFGALFFNEVVYLNVWYNFNLLTIFPAIVYLAIAVWLSLWGGPRHQEA